VFIVTKDNWTVAVEVFNILCHVPIIGHMPHRLHEVWTIAIDVPGVCLSVIGLNAALQCKHD